jgi:LysR family hydrogen peroxide-inducible transcriptional activator
MIHPTLRQLQYIVAVADERHFGRAAEACFVTQPALSAQVRQLESLLEVQIFERNSRRVLVTPAGETLVERARRILMEVEELVEAARVAQQPLSGTLRIGVIPTVSPYLLPRALPKLRRKHRELRPLLREDHTARIVAELEAGRLDVLLLALEAELGNAQTLPLFRDDFLAVMPTNHPLARKRSLRLEDLDGQQVLLLEDGHCLRDQALAVCSAQGASELGDFRATSLSTLTQMVSSGGAMTLLPELALAVETRGRRDLAVRPFRSPAPYRTIGLAWRPSSPKEDEFRTLGESFAARGKSQIP